MDPEKKSLNFIFPTKYVIPKSLKFSHWPSKMGSPRFWIGLSFTIQAVENNVIQRVVLKNPKGSLNGTPTPMKFGTPWRVQVYGHLGVEPNIGVGKPPQSIQF